MDNFPLEFSWMLVKSFIVAILLILLGTCVLMLIDEEEEPIYFELHPSPTFEQVE